MRFLGLAARVLIISVAAWLPVHVAAALAPNGRDLVVTMVSTPSVLVSPGTVFTGNDTVRNIGSETAGNSITRYYLSVDSVKSTNDIRLTGSRVVLALAADTEASGAVSLTVPSTVTAGTYVLFACADNTALVAEVNETNNCTASQTGLAVTYADVVATVIGVSSSTAAPGTSFSISDTARNPSAVLALASTTRYYLSTNTIQDTNDVLLAGTRSVPSLPAGAASSGTRTVTVPASVALGTYRVLACADDLLKVREADEGNNCIASTTTILIGWPDLITSMISDPPAMAAPGTSFTVTDRAQNASAIAAGATTSRYYLSSDEVRDPADTLLTATRSVASLLPGAASTGTKTVTVPTTAAIGSYRLIACVDDLLRVTESDEGNNCIVSAAAVFIAWPDLTTTVVSDPPSVGVPPGGTFSTTDTVTNAGQIPAALSTTRYYLSGDAFKNIGDILLTVTRAVAVLPPGASSTGAKTLTVPATTPLGTYVVLACADDLSRIGERDETNNCFASATFAIRPPNARPWANAGPDQDVITGSNIQLDALASTDADGDPLTYAWSFLATPQASTANLSDPASAFPTFTVDAAGQYVVQLVVHDGKEFSAPDVVTIAIGATRFAALGDTGFGDAGQYAGAEALRRKCDRSGCAFAVLLGDNIYESGVTSATDPQFETKFELPYAPVAVPFYAVLGNHDYGAGGLGTEFEKGQFEVAYTNISSKWRMPTSYYQFSWGDIEFFALDTNMQKYGMDADQRLDVANWLAQAQARWKVALGHHPYRSNGSHGNAGAYDGAAGDPIASGQGVKSFMDEVICGRADLLLTGHDHNLQWLQPNGTCPGTELIVSGAGAKPKSLRSPISPGYNDVHFQAAKLGFVYFVVTASQMTVEFVGANGELLFVRTVTKTE